MQAVVDKVCKATFNELLPNLRIKVTAVPAERSERSGQQRPPGAGGLARCRSSQA